MWYNTFAIFGAEIAQMVEQRTENPRVPSSILGLGTSFYQVARRAAFLIAPHLSMSLLQGGGFTNGGNGELEVSCVIARLRR